MVKYIPKQETISAVINEANTHKNPIKRAYARAAAIIEQIPATDVQPLKHGCWEEVTDYGGWGDTHYRCSVCGEEWYLEDGTPQQNNMNFCPRCGSRMDLEEGNTNG